MRTTQLGEGLPTPYAAVPPHYVKAFPEYLRASGYFCTNNAKTDYQLVNDPQPWKATPFTIWDECGSNAHYKNRPDKNQPFFAVFNIEETHESQNWKKPEKTNPADVPVPPYYPDIPEVRDNIARLYDNIAIMDSMVGDFIKELNESGEAENTVIFFWTDHGDGLPRAKRWLYDSGTHIPLIIKWPGKLKPGSISNQLISSIDFGATVLSIAQIPIPQHFQGRAFLGHQAKPQRNYVYGARDRFDQSYDMVRSVRDKEFLYIRNFYPLKPYILWVPYRNRMSMMQAMLGKYARGELNGPQNLWFQSARPPEELYHVLEDPHQINNLAGNGKYQDILERMRLKLDQWREETNDLGDMNEADMVSAWWKGDTQPITNPPRFVVNAGLNRNLTVEKKGGAYKGPVLLKLYCPTQGASIGYKINAKSSDGWQLYTGPIHLSQGENDITAKAIRYGYTESEIVSARFLVTEN